MIRFIEEITMNAWPALQTVLIDGWVLRFANGYTRRANSVNPVYPGQRSAEEKIAACEQLYRARGLSVTFKMTQESCPDDLDALLEARGYRFEAETSLQLRDLAGWEPALAGGVELADTLSEEWLAGFCRMNRISPQNRETLGQMLGLLVPGKCFAALRMEGQVAACGLGVAQNGLIGFYDIVTDPDYRGRGYGEQVMRSLIGWGKNSGAQTAYLQVMLNNPAALRLYARLGFKEQYRYWYRVSA